ncbi:sensor histidine kinase [Streptomyces sp. ME19-01-6]|uniref:sensor histidine kinase n=1 Tax=Streptomyces sp. ME19-01-6 TaxID=3028686 RepID=UPI0029B3D032|nr:histidine kinase [Streptomyces sp. ME19-01-6]MDX3224298.1 histidine kinase [Streptomyces sp. ME19-01-6]
MPPLTRTEPERRTEPATPGQGRRRLPVARVLRAFRRRPEAAAAETPAGAASRWRADAGLAAVVLAVQCALALFAHVDGDRGLDALGWTLLAGSAVVLIGRRHSPMLVTVAVVLMVGPYHALNYAHLAAVPAGLTAFYTLAVLGPPLRSLLTVTFAIGLIVTIMSWGGRPHSALEMLRSSGWVLSVVVIGEAVRIRRAYIAAIVERAERAERSREEEAARRVAEERLRIARDLHDLLAHSITLIGVQTSVAAHVLIADPERLDRVTLAKALDAISDTCRDARAELRATLQVLRAREDGEADGADGAGTGPPPGLAGLTDLAAAAEAAGVRVRLTVDVDGSDLSPAVGAATYRIVQEALTNAVRHAPGTLVRLTVAGDGAGGLRVAAVDDGPADQSGPSGQSGQSNPSGEGPTPSAAEDPDRPQGYGLIGMRERARSVAGTLSAGPRGDGPGFAVAAVLPYGRAARKRAALPPPGRGPSPIHTPPTEGTV